MQDFRPATLSKRDSNSCVFLCMLLNFQEHLFRRTSAYSCFCSFGVYQNGNMILMVRSEQRCYHPEFLLKRRLSEAVVWRCSVKKVFLAISQNSQENACARVSFIMKSQALGLRPATLLIKRLWHRWFPVNFAIFLRTPFLPEHSGGLLGEFMRYNHGEIICRLFDILLQFPFTTIERELNYSHQQMNMNGGLQLPQ